MKRFRKIITAVLPVMLIACVAAGSYYFINGRQLFEPNNPLKNDARPSHMLLSFGGELEFFEEPDSGYEKVDNESNANETKETTKKQTEPRHEETTAQKAEETKTEKSEKSYSNAENQPQSTAKNENLNSESVSKADSESLGVTEPRKETKEPAADSDTNLFEQAESDSDNTETTESEAETNEEIPGEIKKPLKEESDKIYFTTSVNDVETVEKSDYYFEIYHNYPELTVSGLEVYVNEVRVNQFKGNVLLSEGENTIRVAVEYTDENGKVISVYADYTVYANLKKINIVTDLKNFTSESNLLDFTAYATYCGEEVPTKVTFNSQNVEGTGGNFSVKLKYGENTVAIYASNGEKSASKKYTITCTVLDTPEIYTDLKDETVNSQELEFTAYVVNGTNRASLSITLNGDPLLGVGSVFTAPLNVGNNRIRLKLSDKVNGENITVEKTFTIKYVPLADEETAPYLRYINVSEGMNVNGNEFKLDLDPVDFKGKRIYSEGITVKLNGNVYAYEWQSEYTSYKLWLEGGENKLEIRIADKDGRYTDYSFKINCTVFEDGEQTGTIKISIDANVLGLGYIVSPTEIPIYQGENGAETVIRFLEENGFTYDFDGTPDVGFYLSRIGKSGMGVGVSIPEKLVEYIDADGIEWKAQKYNDSLGEFDYTQGSGWMYSINQSYPNHGLSDAAFKDGDVVRIRFTLAYGKDINGFTSAGGQGSEQGGKGGNYEKTW